jgi:hypothetical protein
MLLILIYIAESIRREHPPRASAQRTWGLKGACPFTPFSIPLLY